MKNLKKVSIYLLNFLVILSTSFLVSLIKPEKAFAATPGSIVINELMWMGSSASTADEWIELRNLTNGPIDLTSWVITGAATGGGDLNIPSGTLPASGFFLISNYDKADSNSVLDVDSDWVTTEISLPNSNAQYVLKDSQGNVIDTADDGAGTPLAGNSTNKYSMERNFDPGDGTLASNWHTAVASIGFDVGATEKGTPKSGNKSELVNPTFTISVSPDPVGQGTVEITVNASERLAENPNLNVLDSGGATINFTGPTLIGTTTYVYQATITQATASGTATISVTGIDTSYNSGTGNQNFTLDSQPPTISNLIPTDKTITNNTTQTVSADVFDVGTGLSSVVMKINGNSVGTFVPPTISLTQTFPDGNYEVKVEAKDNVLNTSSVIWSFTVDTKAPTSSVSPLPLVTTVSSFEIAYTTEDETSGVDFVTLWYRKDGGDWRQYGGNYTSSPIYIDTAPLGGDGFYEFYTVGTDKAGNIESAPSVSDTSTTVDTTAPSSPSNLKGEGGDSEVTLSWDPTPGAIGYLIRYRAEDEDFGDPITISDTSTKITGLKNGVKYYFQVAAVDENGNVSDYLEISATPKAPLIVIPKAKAAAPAIGGPIEEIAPPKAKAEIKPEAKEEGKILGKEEEKEVRNWTPVIVIGCLIILFGAAYGGWKWYQRKTVERW